MKLIENETASMVNLPDASFISTKEYRRFAEFCDSCKSSGYIGLCYGPPGVGKSKSGRHYTNWDFCELYTDEGRSRFLAPVEVREYDTVFCTPPVIHTSRDLQKILRESRRDLELLITSSYTNKEFEVSGQKNQSQNRSATKLIIVDECDRLTAQGFEFFRSIYDDENVAVVFMGMPGLEKRLARYAQLYSRIGFVHEFKTLSLDEVRFLMETKWVELTNRFKVDDFADSEALTALVRTSHGNFRLLERMVMQIGRLMRINGLRFITKELVDAAREILIIGTD